MRGPGSRPWIVGIVAAIASGCVATEDELATRLHDEVGAAPISYPPTCEELSRRADHLIEATMRCEADVDCDPVLAASLVEDTCLPQLSCYLPISHLADVDAFLDEIAVLDDQYAESCDCAIATCANPRNMIAVCDELACGLVNTPDIADYASPPQGPDQN